MMRYAQKILTVFLVAFAMGASPPASHARPFDLKHSTMTVYVYKQGIFAFAADNHEISAPIASGSYDEAAQRVELTVAAKDLKVLDPSMPADRRATVQGNTVGPLVLDADKYPTIAFRSTKIEPGKTNTLMVTGDLTLHGQTHAIVLSVVKASADHFTGSVMVRQSAFGITPIRIVGGTVKVKDDVKVVFDIYLATAS